MEVGVHGVHALLHAEGEHRQEAKQGRAQTLHPHVAGQDARALAQILKLKAAIHKHAAIRPLSHLVEHARQLAALELRHARINVEAL